MGPAKYHWIVDCLTGNEYHFIGLANHPRPFHFVLPAADLPRRATEYAITVLGALRAATPADLARAVPGAERQRGLHPGALGAFQRGDRTLRPDHTKCLLVCTGGQNKNEQTVGKPLPRGFRIFSHSDRVCRTENRPGSGPSRRRITGVGNRRFSAISLPRQQNFLMRTRRHFRSVRPLRRGAGAGVLEALAVAIGPLPQDSGTNS